MLQPDRYWAKLCEALGIPQAAADPRFADMGTCAANVAACVALLDEIFATRPRAEWIARLAPGGDFIVSVVNAVERVVGMPVRLSDTEAEVIRILPSARRPRSSRGAGQSPAQPKEPVTSYSSWLR